MKSNAEMLKMLKFFNLVEFQTAQIMYKARYNLIPGNILKMFCERDGGYNFRGKLNLSGCITMKKCCISICGVKLWYSLHDKLKQCPSIIHFKKMYKDMILTKYKDEEGL